MARKPAPASGKSSNKATRTARVTRRDGATAMMGATDMMNSNFSTETLETYLDEVNGKAKAAIANGAKLGVELAEIAAGNVEAASASAKAAAKGFEQLAQDGAALAKESYESATAALKRYATVKTPADLLALNSELARAAFDNAVGQASKLGEAAAKVAGDVAQPISARYAVASDKIKAALNG